MCGRLLRAAAEAVADSAHGFWFGFTKKNCIDVELAHGPVLDDDFPQNGMIAIFIVTLT
jgi:hypothetical protein